MVRNSPTLGSPPLISIHKFNVWLPPHYRVGLPQGDYNYIYLYSDSGICSLEDASVIPAKGSNQTCKVVHNGWTCSKKNQGVSCSKGNGRLWIASSHSRRRPTKKPLWSCSHIYGYSLQATPRKPTWNPKMEIWKMIFFFKQMIFRFHVSFGECNYHLESGYVWIHGLNVLHIRWIGCFSFSYIPMGRQHCFLNLRYGLTEDMPDHWWESKITPVFRLMYINVIDYGVSWWLLNGIKDNSSQPFS